MSYTFSSYQIADLAMRFEAEGAKYYRRVAAFVTDPALKEAFGRLADLEAGHMATFSAMARELEARDKTYEYAIDLESVMKSQVERITKAFRDASSLAAGEVRLDDVLVLAVRLEEESVRVYTDMREKFIGRFAPVLEKIIAEEKEHLKMFTAMKEDA